MTKDTHTDKIMSYSADTVLFYGIAFHTEEEFNKTFSEFCEWKDDCYEEVCNLTAEAGLYFIHFGNACSGENIGYGIATKSIELGKSEGAICINSIPLDDTTNLSQFIEKYKLNKDLVGWHVSTCYG